MSSWFDLMKPAFIARQAFGPWDGEKWVNYVEWSGLDQLAELVTLDPMLSPLVLNETKGTYWPHIVNEYFMLDYFTNVEFLIEETKTHRHKNILCVFRNPTSDPIAPEGPHPFECLGYDLVDVQGSASALSNCGGFPDVFESAELTPHGLIQSRARATEIQSKLRALHPEEPHANCHVWAIFRLTRRQSAVDHTT